MSAEARASGAGLGPGGPDPARFPRVVLGTVCIPWTERWALDRDLFAATVELHARLGIRDLYVFGTAGEGFADWLAATHPRWLPEAG